ncbi:LamG-like jellyroll fold domain-containing protein [Bacteroidota bacterium]
MKKFIIKSFCLLILFCFSNSYAQEYKEMMDNPNHNVYTVIKKGNEYFKNREKGKGSGYKQFQRWIIENEDRFYPTGDRTNFRVLEAFEIKKKEKLNHKKTSNKSSNNAIEDYNWEEVGPFVELKENFSNKRNGNGRVDAIWVDPNDEKRIYVGTRGGGLWTTIDEGINWIPKTDDLGITGVKSIAVNPNNINEIYIATAIAGSYSIGVFKSLDAGNTWTQTGFSLEVAINFTTINKLLINPNNPSKLFAATSNGLVKTDDGFQTYSTVLSGNIIDIEFKPGDTNTVYASNDTNNTIYKSVNGGTFFTTTGLTTTNKPQIAVSPNQPNSLFVADNGASYKSTNSGTTFTTLGIPDGNVGQYGGFAVSDTNANIIINGSIDTWTSFNGGVTDFTKTTNWIYDQSTGVGGNFVHADIREIVVVNGTIYLGTDGWLVKSTDGGFNYKILSFSMGNHEIYKHGMGVSQSSPNTIVIGTQDNGTSILSNGKWIHWKGGDGGTSMIDKNDADIIYGSLYNGDFKRTNSGGLTTERVDLGDTKPGTLPPLIQHPTIAGKIFLGEASGQVWKSTNYGDSWTTIANLGTSNVVDEMNISDSNPNYIYTSAKNRIWKTTDGGANWTEISSGLPNLVITGIAIDYDDPNRVSVSYNNYSIGTKVYTTSNGGSSWSNISGSLPNLPLNDIVYDNAVNNPLYVATDTGVYYKDDTLSDWVTFGNNLPNTRVNDLEIQFSTKRLYAATWGRGVWKSELVSNSSTAIASFSATSTNIVEGDSIVFTDNSNGIISSWSWSFEGGTPATSTSKNPTVKYNTEGTYNVTLQVTNSTSSDTETKTGYITVFKEASGDLMVRYIFEKNLNDETNYLRNATATGSANYGVGSDGTGSSYNLNGSNNLTIGGYTGILAANDRTVTAWIKTSSDGAISSWGTATTGNRMTFRINAGKLRVEVSGGYVTATQTVSDGNWHHVAFTFKNDGTPELSETLFYVDGILDPISTQGNPISINTLEGGNVLIGNHPFNSQFIGNLDDFRIYSKFLTPEQITKVKDGETSLSTDYTAINQNRIIAYPNTVTNNLTLLSTNDFENESISIYSYTGVQLPVHISSKNANKIELDMSDFSTGMYLVVLKNSNNKSVFKIIKQ